MSAKNSPRARDRGRSGRLAPVAPPSEPGDSGNSLHRPGRFPGRRRHCRPGPLWVPIRRPPRPHGLPGRCRRHVRNISGGRQQHGRSSRRRRGRSSAEERKAPGGAGGCDKSISDWPVRRSVRRICHAAGSQTGRVHLGRRQNTGLLGFRGLPWWPGVDAAGNVQSVVEGSIDVYDRGGLALQNSMQILENPVAELQVIFDIQGGYFRIFQPKTIGSSDGTYFKMLGRGVTPAMQVQSGAMKWRCFRGSARRQYDRCQAS